MKTWLSLLIFSALSLLASCDLDEDTVDPGDNPLPDSLACTAEPGVQNVIFKSLAVGQKSRFVFFTGENYFDTSGLNFQFHPDTLVLEIVDNEDDKFLVRECITPGSQPHEDLIFPDSVLFYQLRVENNFLRPRRTPDNPA